MVKGISKKGRSIGPVSRQLEEVYPIPYQVIGTPQWLDTSFPAGVLAPHQRIDIRWQSDLDEPRSFLLRQKILGVDSEGTGADKRSGLDPLDPRSRTTLLQMGTPQRVLLIQPDLIPEFREVLESEDILHILQNAVYDFKFLLTKYSSHIRRIFDTMLAEQLLTSGLLGIGVGLEEIVRKYPPHRLISKEVRQRFVEFNGIFDKKMVYYAARDIHLMFPVMNEQVELLKKWKLSVVAQDEFNVIPCTAMMELGGVYIDAKVLRLALVYWEAREAELASEILALYDEEVRKKGNQTLFLIPEMTEFFDLKSAAQKLAALRRLGFEIDDVRRDTLEEMVDHPIGILLAEYSEVTKITSTYGESMISRINPITHRLHPEFNQLGSGDLEAKKGKSKKETIATGRYSSDFQQLPRAVPRYSEVTGPLLASVQALFAEKLAALQ